jgi:hypothetical protein
MSIATDLISRPTDQSVEVAPNTRRRRILDTIIISVVCTSLILQVITWAGYSAQSTVSLLGTLMFAAIGIIAGATAAKLRKQRKIDDMIFAYRIAVWCLFLALIQLPSYYSEKDQERFAEELARNWDLINKHYRLESDR